MKSTSALWTRTTKTALLLPVPASIVRVILASGDGADNGLRAANYDSKVRGGSNLTHPERMAEQRNPELRHDGDTKPPVQRKHRPRAIDHLRDLSKASERYVDAVAALNAECIDGGAPDTWEEAVKDADLLDSHDLIQSALDVGRDVTRWVNQATASVRTIRTVQLHYVPKPASRWVQIREDGLQADEICDTCASLDPPVYIAARHKEHLACRHCNDLRLEHGERPPRWVKQAFHHGTQLEYRKALTAWHAELRMGVCG